MSIRWLKGEQREMVLAYDSPAVAGKPARRLRALRAIRERKALSQEELAATAGLSRATVGALESQRSGAQYQTIRKLAQALGVEPSDLYGEPGA
jgi:DNA-binding XRE family transcriptional regulator